MGDKKQKTGKVDSVRLSKAAWRPAIETILKASSGAKANFRNQKLITEMHRMPRGMPVWLGTLESTEQAVPDVWLC